MLDQETINLVVDRVFYKFIAGLTAKGLEVCNRARICRQNFQRAAGRYFFEGFSSLEDGQRAIEPLCVECVVSNFLLLRSNK